MSEDDQLYLAEMLQAASKIERYISGLDETGFLTNPMAIDAVAINLLVIGEAANRLSIELREMDQSIPWPELIGLRNRIAHGYAHVDQQLVWDIVTIDLPQLRTQLDQLTKLAEGL